MAALTKGRNTPSRSGDVRSFPVAASTTIFAGAMVALNASGDLVPFSTSTTLKGVGRADEAVANGGVAGALRCRVAAGIFQFANSASGDLITRADIGSDCYGVDDQTVAKTNGTNTRSIAGKVFDVDDLGVWVKFS